jgi:A/G-specific adenine glycosylase
VRGLSARTTAHLQGALLAWFDVARRPLPWRAAPSPYATWIAEVMLQQTTVAAAGPYWQRFLRRFPDARALAAAARDDVLALWSGLGYYRRARDLHAAARLIVARGGELPEDYEDWLALPGMGPYTAGAVASIAFGQRVPAVDANARRVLLRWLCARPAEAAGLSAAALRDLASRLVHPRRPGDWNQAVMELGALICLPGRPHCSRCPVAARCRAARAGVAGQVVPARVRPPNQVVLLSCLGLERDGAVLLVPADTAAQARLRGWGRPVREGFAGLYDGLWGMMSTPWYATAEPAVPAEQAVLAAWSRWMREAGLASPPRLRLAGEVGQAITRYRLRILLAVADWPGATVPVRGGRWVEPGAARQLPLAGFGRKLLALRARRAPADRSG